jgi:membrane protease YdiL (CAAX protease family)
MEPESQGRRRQALAEVACLVGLIETIMWGAPFARQPAVAFLGLVLLVATLLVVTHLRDRRRPREIGLRVDNLGSALRAYCAPFGIALALLVAVGLAAGTLRLGPRFLGMLAGVPAWAFLQQYMLLAFAHERFRIALGGGWPSVLASAGMFALLHLPNPALTVACAAAGLVWAWQYERGPNLFANVATHTLGSAVLANALPPSVLKSMVVGYNYFLR